MTSLGVWALLAGVFAVTYAWRGAGVALGNRINFESAAFRWISAVAYAMLAGLIARMLLLPQGQLAETPLPDRLGAAAVALLVYFLTLRNTLLAVLAGAATLVLLTFAAGS
jgi:branched-subunit amino acid transport protein